MKSKYLLSGDNGVNGIFRCKLVHGIDLNDIRVYIPGISSISPFNDDGTLNLEKYNEHKLTFPKVQWCTYNIESKEFVNQDSLCWCMFENGDFRRPVVISYAVIGGAGTSSNAQFGGTAPSSQNQDLVDGDIHNAVFTAYCATSDSSSNGMSKNNEILDHTKLTCAGSVELAFNTNIKILNTGSEYDNKIYRVNDRRDSAKIKDNTYYFDILVADEATVNAFGTKTGQVMIGGTLQSRYTTDEDAHEIAKNAINLATGIADDNTYTYVYGGKGPTTFDCSGFVWYCYNNSKGGNLSNLSYAATGSMELTYAGAGFENVTSIINLSTGEGLITGDILLSAAGGHVDMYVGNGLRVGAHSSRTGIYVDNYGYNQTGYNNKYDCILRYKGNQTDE